jgi:hypothetical protein
MLMHRKTVRCSIDRALWSWLACGTLLISVIPSHAQQRGAPPPPTGVKVGTFGAEVAQKFTTADGLSADSVLAVAVTGSGRVVAGTQAGLSLFVDGRWQHVTDYTGPVPALAADGTGLLAVSESALYRAEMGSIEQLAELPTSGGQPVVVHCVVGGERRFLGTNAGLYELRDGMLAPVDELNSLLDDTADVRQVAAATDGRIAVAAEAGLFLLQGESGWQRLLPQAGARSWAPRDVRGVTFDSRGRLWFCEPQGTGVQDESGWKLLTGGDGLPYADFTSATAGADGSVLFSTHAGAIRYDGETWEYRQAPRWLPHNDVRAIAVGADGTEWYATGVGVGRIEHKPMTLAEKAKFFEDEVDKYHRRTPYEYVLEVQLKDIADKREWTQHDSDNDGLWTAMYGTGECFVCRDEGSARQGACHEGAQRTEVPQRGYAGGLPPCPARLPGADHPADQRT